MTSSIITQPAVQLGHEIDRILAMGEFQATVQKQNLTGMMLSLYETPQAEAPFLLDLG